MSNYMKKRKIIIPFKLQQFNFTDEYLYFLGRKHWIEAYSDVNAAMVLLKDTILSLTESFTDASFVKPEKDDVKIAEPKLGFADENEDESACEYDRETIVKILIDKTFKYPYNIYSKVSTP